ncbi:hypothetical protein FRACYDRAFT_232539 [Fragilariopsis cylindrus CCMP1102]|uniref:Uncharacterized protein n=1 Tax=Fragilariopsis cylindrus CCMP1102 TaxID=635003 RepID=A0A1E7FW87_9STRA|nr:hypothetical protein FRACYDRAFT_232539 [Fragilariopsis cylindrus CCMP1102]|eukprot:OEU22384.1 hypothetical protein FRACYDRAFT_232539 [Fragilariopsis cylindrus CCMP1102]
MVYGNLSILSYCVCWFFCSISGSDSHLHVAAAAAVATTKHRNGNFRGSGSTGTKRNSNVSSQQQQQQQQQLPVAKGDGTTRKKEDKEDAVGDPTASNTAEVPSSSSPQIISAETTTTTTTTTVELLPFSLLINGSVEDEFDIREELQDYLLDYYREQEEEEEDTVSMSTIDSIRLETVSHTFQFNGQATTFFEYEGQAIVVVRSKQEQEQQDDDIDNGHIQNIQTMALENTEDLQGYFLKWFALQHVVVAGGIDKGPIVVIEVQVNDNPTIYIDTKKTRNDSSSTSIWKITVSIGCVMMILAGIIGVSLICREKRHRYNDHFRKGKLSRGEGLDDDHHAVVDVISDVDPDEQPESIIYDKSILRSDSDESKKRSMLFFLPNFLVFKDRIKSITSPVIENENEYHTTESNANVILNLTSDTGGSSNSNNNRFADKNRFDPSLFTSKSTAIDLTVPARNSKGFEDAAIEKEMPKKLRVNTSPQDDTGRSKKSSFTSTDNLSPCSATSQHNPEEGHSVVGKIHIYDVTSNDDDSMMGYSLASHEGDNVNDPNKESFQDINNECSENNIGTVSLHDSMSDESSRSSESPRNPLFAGIHKILDMPNHSNNLSPEIIEILPDVIPSNNISDNENNIHESDDDTASSYKEDDSNKGDMSSIMSGFSSAGISDNDLKCHDTITKNKLAVPSEEARGGPFVLPMRNKRTISNPTLGDVPTPDDASDAPSDERNNGLINAIANSNVLDSTIANSNLLDNDPTLIDHLGVGDLESDSWETVTANKNHCSIAIKMWPYGNSA